MLQYCIVHLLHPVRAYSLINQLAKKRVSSLATSLATLVKERAKYSTFVTMTWAIPSQLASCLANYRLLHVSLNCCLIVIQSVHEANVCACN